MNKHTTHPSGPQEPRPAPAPDSSTSANAQAATDTIYKVAEVTRALKCVTHVMEKWFHLAAGTDEHLTLSHWLVLVRLSNAPTCKQIELKSDTKIAAAYLSRLLDDLTREGLVRRHRSTSDRRQILLALTAYGRSAVLELLASLNGVMEPFQLSAIEHLSASLEQFVSLTDGKGQRGES